MGKKRDRVRGTDATVDTQRGPIAGRGANGTTGGDGMRTRSEITTQDGREGRAEERLRTRGRSRHEMKRTAEGTERGETVAANTHHPHILLRRDALRTLASLHTQ